MERHLIKRILYTLIPLAIFLFIVLPDIHKTIAIVGNHSTTARIIKNPVNGKFSYDIVRALEEGDFYHIDDELYDNLKNTYLIYNYTSLEKQYTDSVKVLDALSMDIPVFYKERMGEDRIFPIYAYKNYNISKSFVDFEMGGTEAGSRDIIYIAILFLMALGASIFIYKDQTDRYKENEIRKIMGVHYRYR